MGVQEEGMGMEEEFVHLSRAETAIAINGPTNIGPTQRITSFNKSSSAILQDAFFLHLHNFVQHLIFCRNIEIILFKLYNSKYENSISYYTIQNIIFFILNYTIIFFIF